MLTSVYLSKWNDNTPQWLCAWGDRVYQIWLWSEGCIKWFVFLLLILHRARQIGRIRVKKKNSFSYSSMLLSMFLGLLAWCSFFKINVCMYAYVYIFAYFVSLCVCMHVSPLPSPLVGSDYSLKELVVSFHHVGLGHRILLFQGIRLGSPRFFFCWVGSPVALFMVFSIPSYL